MRLNGLAKQVKNLALIKGFPITEYDTMELLGRIDSEMDEVRDAEVKWRFGSGDTHALREYLHEELADVLIQTIQAMVATGADVEKVVEAKMKKNWKRKWR